mgnify:CR=1 FL=1
MPSLAYSLKQMRQSPKSLIKARLRPQRKQRRTMRVENFGFFSARALVDVLAIAKQKTLNSVGAIVTSKRVKVNKKRRSWPAHAQSLNDL